MIFKHTSKVGKSVNFGAKALLFNCLTYPSLKAGVIEIQRLMDFSPKFRAFGNRLIFIT